MKILASKLKRYRAAAFLAPTFKLLEAALELLIPLFVSDIIDRGINGGVKEVVYIDAAIMVALGLLGLGFSVVGQYFSAKTATGFSAEVRKSVYDKLLAYPPETTDKMGVSAMITRMTSDVSRMQTGINLALRLLLRSPFVVFGALVAAMIIDLKAALVFAAIILVLGIIVGLIMGATLPKYVEAQRRLDDVSLSARENLTGVRVIRAFGAEDDEIKEYRKKTAALEKFQNFTGRISALLNPLTLTAVNFAVILLLYVGAIRVNAGALSQGQVVALYDYMSQILIELVKLANLAVTVSKALACGRRVEEVLEKDSSYVKAGGDEKSDSFIEFRNVSLRYGDGGNSLSDINLSIEKGQTIGVIGGTGSGKTSLVSLIPRFYDASEGTLFIDGKDVRSYDVADVREKVGIVLQRPAVFSGTIRSNVLLGKPDADEEEIWQAIDAAQARDVAEAKGGLDGEIAQRGKNLSGGQKQRLCIARALVKKPEILILDDSSSALDYATDLRLRWAIKALDYSPTVIIVSQRASSVAGADKIIVLDEGRAVGIGTDEQLSSSCEVYAEIKRSQQKESGL